MDIVQTIRQELKRNAEPKLLASSQDWFKESIKCHGVATPTVRQISREQYQNVKQLSKLELFAICETLMKTQYQEEFLLASDWAFRRRKEFTPSDFKRFETWVKRHISNWATCDDFCTKSLGYLIFDHPKLESKLIPWAKSKNMWVRRASAVSMIISLRRKQGINIVFKIALSLLENPEDLVQKGYGWMLKEASKHHQKEVFDFVIKHKSKMPRTALRYAIEKMPKDLKQKAMK